MQNNFPKPIIIAIKAIILPTFGVQVGFRVDSKLHARKYSKLFGSRLALLRGIDFSLACVPYTLMILELL